MLLQNALSPDDDDLVNGQCNASMDLQPLSGADPTESVQALLAKATGTQLGEK